MTKRCKIFGLLLIFLALACFQIAKSQNNSSPSAQNFHQWGAVTLFNGLPSDTVRAIAQTPDGVLWFGTDGGLARFDGRRVQTIALENAESKKIFALEISSEGVLWVGTQNGAFHYENGKFQKVSDTQNYAVTAFLFGDSIFLGTENGVILKLRENIRIATSQSFETGANNLQVKSDFQIEKIPDQIILDGESQPLKITSLARRGDSIIAGTRSRSILVIENNQALETSSRPRPFFVNALAADRQGKIWLGADADNSGSSLFLIEDPARLQRIGENLGSILSVKADENGVWIGTGNNGLLRFHGEQWSEHFTFGNTAGGLRSNTIFALFVDREGVVWIGTNRGVCRFDAASPFNKTLSENSNSNFVRTLYRASDGQIYAGTNRGLFLFSGGNWTETGNFSPRAVYAVGEDSQKNLLIATSNGLFDFDQKQKIAGDMRAVVNFKGAAYAAIFGRGVVQIENQAQIFANDSLTALFADDQNLWIGTARDGVFVYDGKETKQETSLESMRGAAIRKIIKDGGNNLWFASERGLFLYKDGQLENIIADQITRDAVITGTDIWAATEGGGILHLKRDEIFGWMQTNLNVEQGLPSQKIFALLPIENRLLIGTNRGVVNYSPGTSQPKIIATRVLSQRLHETEELNQPIALNYPQNSLLVEVSGLSSRTFPEQFQYGFLLKNAEGEILEKRLSNDSQFAPAGLAPGEYNVEARAFNKDLVVSEPLTIKFSVADAPFPRTAVTLGILLAFALIALIWAIIETVRIAQRNRQLAAARFDLANEAERERKRIARDLHDQTLADLRSLMLMSDKLPADTSHFRSEIESVSTEIRRICEDLSPSVLENVGLLAALEFLLNHTFENCKFSADAEEENLNFSPNQQMQIYRIAQEVLTNIKHHSDAKCVEMKIEAAEGGEFVLSIEDDGATFAPAGNTPKGRGISNIKSRTALIKAEIAWLESESGGTIFQLKKTI
jgi:signal transduction histidine kinase/ligand-binding sensor domain-containing protein